MGFKSDQESDEEAHQEHACYHIGYDNGHVHVVIHPRFLSGIGPGPIGPSPIIALCPPACYGSTRRMLRAVSRAVYIWSSTATIRKRLTVSISRAAQ